MNVIPLRQMTLQEALDASTVEADPHLYEKLEEKKLRCFACGHRCLIFPGQRGICKVRYNEGGVLRVPYGYAAGVQSDPVEKKPYFHAMPGSNALTFGMLGCDFHCSYCFPGDTPIVTEKGMLPIEKIFQLGGNRLTIPNGEASHPQIRIVTERGEPRPVNAAFKHHFEGELVAIQPFYLPKLRCTPGHRLYAVKDLGTGEIETLRADQLTPQHYLVIPKHYVFSKPIEIDVPAYLNAISPSFKIFTKLTPQDVERIMVATAGGATSQEIGQQLGKDPSYIRHVRSKVNRGLWQVEGVQRLVVEDGQIRFLKERRPGIPLNVPLDERLARLLGYYCAEGCVTYNQKRPNSGILYFTVSPNEEGLAKEIRSLLYEIFKVDARILNRPTGIRVEIAKASLIWLFAQLCGARAREKHVPAPLFEASRSVAKAFLDAYVQGDGHAYDNGKMSTTTVSNSLAYGVAWLALKLGHLPSLYRNVQPETKQIEGRDVRQATEQYTVVRYEENVVSRRFYENSDYYFIPIRALSREPYAGPVYNLEVDDPAHNYLASFFLVKNCQNWVTSQALRDSAAGAAPTHFTPEALVQAAQRTGARLVVSSYNEPLITSEWSMTIFKQAKAVGLVTGFVSNGNATPEALDFIKPYTDCYKVDLKSMRQKNYRELGGVLKHVLWTIEALHERGFWLEVLTLVVPGFNDSDEELRDAAQFIAGVSPDIPWHVTAFHKDYKMTEPDNTTSATLVRAAEIGAIAGLHYVYAGNRPGEVGPWENTYCPHCKTLLIERYGYVILGYHLTGDGHCPTCGQSIPGFWPNSVKEVQTGSHQDIFLRRPRRVRI
jgi:pyruvate formate lyase activating enzyme